MKEYSSYVDKINKSILDVVNNYEDIEIEYKRITGDEICSNPIVSANNFKLKECLYNISIIIPFWNTEETIKYTLDSISNTHLVEQFSDKVEVVIVDDGNEFDLRDSIDLTKYPYVIKYIKQCHLGRAQAINLGVSSSNGDIIIFCDSDIILSKYAFDELVKRQQLFKNGAIFFGFREDIQKEHISSKSSDEAFNLNCDNRFLTDYKFGWGNNILLDTNMLRSLSCRNNIYIINEEGLHDCWQLFRMVYGFLFSVSKEVFESVGGFAEYLVGWGFDDTEFVSKCLINGIKIIPVPSSFVRHIYHPIRMKSQWEDGRKNEIAMLKHFETLSFENYLDNLDKRIVSKSVFNNVNLQNNHSSPLVALSFVNDEIEYNYLLGNLNALIEKLYNSNSLSNRHFEIFIDAIIRLMDRDNYNKYIKSDTAHIHGYYYALSKYVFDNKLIKINKSDGLIKFAEYVGKDAFIERGLIYKKEAQWLLALKDFFGAYLITNDPALLDECNNCLLQMK